MSRLLGALLILGGAIWSGWRAGRQLERQAACLRELTGALRALRRELAIRLPPLPELLARAAEGTGGPVRDFFRRCAAGARHSEGEFAQCWSREADSLRGSLPDRAVETLLRLGRELGRYDWRGDDGLLEVAIEELEACLTQAEERSLRQGRLYRVLGGTAGALLVLVLL